MWAIISIGSPPPTVQTFSLTVAYASLCCSTIPLPLISHLILVQRDLSLNFICNSASVEMWSCEMRWSASNLIWQRSVIFPECRLAESGGRKKKRNRFHKYKFNKELKKVNAVYLDKSKLGWNERNRIVGHMWSTLHFLNHLSIHIHMFMQNMDSIRGTLGTRQGGHPGQGASL